MFGKQKKLEATVSRLEKELEHAENSIWEISKILNTVMKRANIDVVKVDGYCEKCGAPCLKSFMYIEPPQTVSGWNQNPHLIQTFEMVVCQNCGHGDEYEHLSEYIKLKYPNKKYDCKPRD